MQAGTSRCPSSYHTDYYKPPFPRNEVPDKFFFKDPNNTAKGICKNCYFCRLIKRAADKKRYDKHKEEAKKQNALVQQGIGTLMYCADAIHDGSSGSKYARNAVPIEQFRSRFGDNRSHLVEACIDCRNHRAAIAAENTKKRKEAAKAAGRDLCSKCDKDITGCHALNSDGTISEYCQKCKDYCRKVRRERKAHYKQIIMDRIKKHEVSCMRCEKLYFRPGDDESFIVREINTYVRDGVRY